MSTAIAREKPLFRVGIMTDTHIQNSKDSCILVRKAFEVFHDHHVDMVANLGDIADRHSPEGYRFYRKAFNEVFGDNQPRELILYANHDTIGMPDWNTAFTALAQEIQASNQPYDHLELKGYPFLIYPQNADLRRMEAEIKDSVAKYPGRPVFVLDHVPPYDTTEDSRVWGHAARRKLLDNYPQVVHISGHTHNSLRNENCIWQGGFTAVNAGCLQKWQGGLVGAVPPAKKAYGVLILEVFPEKLVFRCYSVLDGTEYHADKPWLVPWPFVPEHAFYAPENVKAKSLAPTFPPAAQIALSPNKPFTELSFSFPNAHHHDGVFLYSLALARKTAEGTWETFAHQDCDGYFHLSEDKRPKQITGKFSAGYFDNGRIYKLMVTPLNFSHVAGKTIETEFTLPEISHGTVVFETKTPMEDCPFMTGLDNGDIPPCQDGYYEHNGSNNRLVLPDGIWEGPAGTSFRTVFDIRKIQSEGAQWTIVLRNPQPMENANERIYTAPGSPGLQRFVIDFSKQEQDYNYYLLVREGLAGRIRFEYIRIERMD